MTTLANSVVIRIQPHIITSPCVIIWISIYWYCILKMENINLVIHSWIDIMWPYFNYYTVIFSIIVALNNLNFGITIIISFAYGWDFEGGEYKWLKQMKILDLFSPFDSLNFYLGQRLVGFLLLFDGGPWKKTIWNPNNNMNEYDTHYAYPERKSQRKDLKAIQLISHYPSITRAFSSFQHNQNHYPTQNAAVSSHNNRTEIPNIPSPNTKVSCSKSESSTTTHAK